MARRHFAKGLVAKPDVPLDLWMEELRRNGDTIIPQNQINRIAKTVLRKADPKQFLLSHATIVASVDTYAPKNVKLGKQFNRGVQIDVRYPEFRIKPETHSIINNNCFPAGVMILMADGTEKPIEEIKVDDKVISHTGIIRDVVRTFKNPHNGPVYTVRRRGDSRKLTMTGEHPVHMIRPKRNGAKTTFDDTKPFEWVSAGLLQKYDLIYTPRSVSVTATDMSPGKAKLIGYFLAEGYYHKQAPARVSQNFRDAFPGENSIPCSVVFALNKDETETLAADIVSLLRQEFGVEALIAPHRQSENAITVISTRSLELVQFFLKHVGQKAKEKKLSIECMQLDPELQKLILQGWIEGDGTVKATLTGWISATTSSVALASQMVVLFNRCGVPTTRFMRVTKGRKRVKTADGNWMIETDETKSCTSHIVTVNSVDSTRLMSGSWLEAIHQSASARLKKHNFLKFRVQPDKMLHQVLGIKKESFSGLVYNFETEIDHSYVANGVAVHNCDSWDRPLLLSTYRTFIGASHFLEHIQLPELSKGFIVDAIARDVGHSVYIDILVATDKKHEQLISDILSGRLNALSMGCFMPGTLVTLGDGTLIPIEEIKPDMEVISQKGNICKVNNLQIRTNRWSMRRVKAVGLPIIEATDNHKFYAAKSENLQFRKSKGRKVLIEDSYKLNYVQAGDLKIGDVIATPIPTAVVEPTVTEAEARLLGLWVGDGWKIDNKHDRTRGIGLCINEKETDLIQEVEDIIGHSMWRSGELKQSVNGRPPVQTVVRKTARSAAYLLNHSSCIRSLVDDHISGRTSASKRINQSVMEWPESHQLAFLSGIVDSDGCVSTTKHGTSNVHISTRNSHLANQYIILLARCGMVSTLQKATRPGTKMFPNSAGVDYQIRIGNDQVHKIPSLKINKNKDKIRPSKNSYGRWIQDGYSYTRIKSVSSFDHQGWVYDLEVEKDHSYIANGYGVSNCTSQFTICTKCGNVAYDDASLCPCIAVDGKGSKFLDEDGVEHSIAELIGHVSVPNSNVFIEASWVHTPAFTGAVRRSILNEDEEKLVAMMASSKLTARPVDAGGSRKHASMIHMAKGDDLDKTAEEADPLDALKGLLPVGESDSPEDGDDTEPAPDSTSPDAVKIPPLSDESPADNSDEAAGSKPKAKTDKVDTVVNKIEDSIIDAVIKKVEDRFNPKPEDVGSVMVTNPSVDAGNDNLVTATKIANAVLADDVFDRDIKSIATRIISHGSRTASVSNRVSTVSHKDMLILLWAMDKRKGREYPTSLYKVAMKVGSMANYPSRNAFLASVKVQLGCALTPSDIAFFIEKAELTSIAGF